MSAVAARTSPAPGPSGARTMRRPVPPNPTGWRLAALSLTALGVVYGDIGTSPLYAFKECFRPAYGLRPDAEAVYGVLSLIAWALILIVSVKYVALIMRLDNHGEGGILALLALMIRTWRDPAAARGRAAMIALGLFGAALLYGDGIITPAISVLSAVEGLEIATPALAPWVITLTSVILFLLFAVQRSGTARVGGVFGPIMLVWFSAIGLLGAAQVARAPAILGALDPWHGVRFFLAHGHIAFLTLGAVVLAVTGAEALYADLGHFGRRPIRLVWFVVVLPGLLLNYFGQGALVLSAPTAIANPFYLLVPRALLYPMIGLATVATVIASQALISGAFSLTQQSIQLRYSPRLTIVHTSREEAGQIYMPGVNGALMVGCLLLVVGFRSSSALGSAYGVAVTGTMAITTALFYVIARRQWGWSLPRALGVAGAFIAVDLALFGANLVKVEHGGWVPLVLAGAIFLLMTTWRRGTLLVRRVLARQSMPVEEFLAEVERRRPPRVPGTAVFLTADVEGIPLVLLLHLRLNKALHEHVILLSVITEEVPEVPRADRVQAEPLAQGFHRVRAFFGFMETPNVAEVVAMCCDLGVAASEEEVTYVLGRARLLPSGPGRMMRWRKRLYVFMTRNASSAADFFGIPPNRVVELGARIEV